MKGVALLGATGSIGSSALAVLERFPESFRLVAATAGQNAARLAEIAGRFNPELCVVADDRVALPAATQARWRRGRNALLEAAAHPGADIVLNAVVGAAGLEPTLVALAAGKRVALANKESLVCGGELVMAAVREGGGELLPVDSEHSAIFQCLAGEERGAARRLILTASGGPFRGWSEAELAGVQVSDALQHPTWNMGAKITVDSATLANKALEVIEAHHLFEMEYDDIDVVVHPQSIIHSMVEFTDGSVLAQLGFPSMELPVQYALAYPERQRRCAEPFDPVRAGELTFEPLPERGFDAFALGVQAGRTGGTMPAVYNAAKEVAVAAFLDGRLSFAAIPRLIEETLNRSASTAAGSLAAVLEADARARSVCHSLIDRDLLC